MAGLGTKIRELRESRLWTQNELAKRSGIGRSYISLLETDNLVKPSADYIVKLARAFNIRPEELYQAAGYIKEVTIHGFRSVKETPQDILERLRVAISSTVPIYEDFPFHAGSPVEPVDQLSVIKYRARDANLEGYYAYGNCLEPTIHDGDIIIIDRDRQIENGDVVVALVNGKQCIARLKKIADELYLENNEGRIKLEQDIIAALVIEVRRRLK